MKLLKSYHDLLKAEGKRQKIKTGPCTFGANVYKLQIDLLGHRFI